MAKLISGTRVYGTATVDTQLFVSGNNAASSTQTGALQVVGGVGVGGNVFVGGALTATGVIYQGAWAVSTGSVNSGTLVSLAVTATQIQTVFQTANAAYYPTFVDSNNATAIGELVYTTSSFSINPNTGNISIAGITTVTNTTASTSTTTGALTVRGGVGVGGNLYIGGTYLYGDAQNFTIGVTPDLTDNSGKSVTINSGDAPVDYTDAGSINLNAGIAAAGHSNGGGIYLQAGGGGNPGVGGSINLAAGDVSSEGTAGNINLTAGGGSPGVTQGNIILQTNSLGQVRVTNTDQSSSTTTGALRVFGGVGVGGNLYVANTSYVAGAQIITTATLANYVQSFAGGTVPFSVNITSSTQATSTSTGSLVVAGGVGIGGNVFVGGALTATGVIYQGQWAVSTGSLVSLAVTATQIQTVFQTANAVYYPTFVDSNNATAIGELVYTTSSFVINPSTGRVGLGTVTPLANFQVGNSSALTNYQGAAVGIMLPTGSGSWLELAENTTNGTSFRISKDASTGVVINTNVRDLGFKTNSYGDAIADCQIVLKTDGNVGIGIASPESKLHVSGGVRITGITTVTNITAAISTNSGALQVTGGVGIGGDLFVGGNITANRLTIQFTTVTTTLIQTDDIISTYNTTQSTGTTSGALIVGGGVGVGGDVFVGGALTATGVIYQGAWAVSTGSVNSGTLVSLAVTATQIQTVFQTADAAYYPTFVDSNNATAIGELVYTTSSFSINPNNGNVSIAGITTVTNTTAATSTSTGALQVRGGVGIGGSLYTGGMLIGNSNTFIIGVTPDVSQGKAIVIAAGDAPGSVTDAGSVTIRGGAAGPSASTAGDINLIAGSGAGSVYITAASGNLSGGGSITLQAGLLNAVGSDGQVIINRSTAATSTITGALRVYGGVGIGGQVNIGGNLFTTGTIYQGQWAVSTGSGGTSFTGGTVPFSVNITSSTQATSTSTGSLVVAGGVGIGGNVFVGGALTATGVIYQGPWAVNTGSVSTATLAVYETVVLAPTTTFTVPGGYAVGNIQVSANGIILGSGDYTASDGTTVVVNRSRNIGDVIRVMGLSGSWATVPTYAFVATEVTASSNGQTTFTVSYNAASTQVYLNGVLLNTADYTASNGTTVVLASGTGVQIGHVMRVLSYSLYNISGALSLSGGTVNGTVNVTGSLRQNGVSVNAISAAMSIALGM